jgi:signal transduction histidine kinase
MTLGSNIGTRVSLLLLSGFVVIQLVILAALALPTSGAGPRPYNLPPPAELAAMVRAIESTPPDQRTGLLTAFNGSLYTMRLLTGPPVARGDDAAPDLAPLHGLYAAVLPGHAVRIEGRPGPLGRLIRQRPGPMHFLSPVQITVFPVAGATLEVDSRPSLLVRTYLRQRAGQGLVGALLVLVALLVAIRQTTRPIARLSEGVRSFGADLSAPDLVPAGSRELRTLAEAFNEMKARIAELVADRTRMLAAIAHDMRTYLTRLRLRIEFIEDADQRKRAEADLAELGAMLDDTLLFAGQNQRRTLPRSIDVAEELTAIAALRAEIGEAVRLEPVDLGTRLVIKADPLSLRRMVSNLIDNGLRYATCVTLSAWPDAGDVLVRVADDGPGVPPELLARLGEPYVRGEPSRNRTSGGVGLGLAIVRALAAENDAVVTMGNREGRGFEVSLRFNRA